MPTVFPHWYNLNDLSWCEVFFSSLSQYLLYYEKLPVKTTLTTMGHFFAKKLNFCPSDIIWNPTRHVFAYLTEIYLYNLTKMSWREISSPRLNLGNQTPWLFWRSKKICIGIYYEIISSLVNKNCYYINILFLFCYFRLY